MAERYRIDYLSGCRGRVETELDKREIPYVPGKGNGNFVLASLTPERADELKGLEGIRCIKEDADIDLGINN